VNEAGTKMSITGLYVRVAPSDLERLNRDPEAFYWASTASMTPGWENQPSTEPWISIEKAWAALGYLLDKATDGNLDVVFGGTPIGEDCGFGPPRYLPPDEVRQAADMLRGPRSTAWLRTMTPANWQRRRSIPATTPRTIFVGFRSTTRRWWSSSPSPPHPVTACCFYSSDGIGRIATTTGLDGQLTMVCMAERNT
jgi:hypothetical protein